jgi:hypothetical protein
MICYIDARHPELRAELSYLSVALPKLLIHGASPYRLQIECMPETEVLAHSSPLHLIQVTLDVPEEYRIDSQLEMITDFALP